MKALTERVVQNETIQVDYVLDGGIKLLITLKWNSAQYYEYDAAHTMLYAKEDISPEWGGNKDSIEAHWQVAYSGLFNATLQGVYIHDLDNEENSRENVITKTVDAAVDNIALLMERIDSLRNLSTEGRI